MNVKMLYRILAIFLTLLSCKSERLRINQETILNNISHVEDSIYYKIDSLPPLCDILDMKKQFVDIGDSQLYCEIEGKGPPLVVIHGGPGGTHHYFHPWFSEAANFSKVIYYDQRGCGQSDFNPGKEGYSFEQAINDLDKLRQKLGIDKWIVCGYSYGGAIAQFYTATFPQNTLGMILIGASPMLKDSAIYDSRQGDYVSDEERIKIQDIYKLYGSGQINLRQLLYNKAINGDWKRQNFYRPTNDEINRASLYEWVNDKGFNRIMSSSFSKYNLKGVFDSCPISTFICEGKWDLTWSSEKKNLLKKNHPNAEFILYEHSGHSIFYDEPNLFFSALKKFVRQVKNAPDSDILKWQEHAHKIIGSQKLLFKREADFFELIKKEGIEKGMDYYKEFKSRNKNGKLFTEAGLNILGYSYFQDKDYKMAILIFKMNVEDNPNSWNVYDSLGEVFLASGNEEEAKKNYKKSVELNPSNEYGKKILKELQE